MHIGSGALLDRFRARLPGDVLGVASVPGLLASTAAWTHGEPWLRECVSVLDANRRSVHASLVGAGIGIDGPLVDATYLQWLDFSAAPVVAAARAADPSILVSTMLRERARVALNDGPTFGPGLEGCARLNFATSPDLLKMLCGRIVSFAERSG
jgi:cysteine-S-conjugate beta-lyase